MPLEAIPVQDTCTGWFTHAAYGGINLMPCFHLNWNSVYNSHHVLQEMQTVWRIKLLQENLGFSTKVL